MKSPNPIKVAIVWLMIVFILWLMFIIWTIFNDSVTNNCPYTLLVWAWWLNDAMCVDFNSFVKQ